MRSRRRHFPIGPEKLAEHLKVKVRQSPLRGCDGWCLSAEGGPVIRINSRLAKSRRRFTLASELSMLLDIPTVIGESLFDMLRSDDAGRAASQRDRRRNALATRGSGEHGYGTSGCSIRVETSGEEISGVSNWQRHFALPISRRNWDLSTLPWFSSMTKRFAGNGRIPLKMRTMRLRES